jgi:hypothetical protein
MILPLEQQVTSLELSKKLKELGCPKDSYFCWLKCGHKKDFTLMGGSFAFCSNDKYEMYPAYTVAELLELLPKYLLIQRCNDDWAINDNPSQYLIKDLSISNETNAANVLAQMMVIIYSVANQLSNCCNADLEVNSDDEGTNYYACKKCGKACDLKL